MKNSIIVIAILFALSLFSSCKSSEHVLDKKGKKEWSKKEDKTSSGNCYVSVKGKAKFVPGKNKSDSMKKIGNLFTKKTSAKKMGNARKRTYKKKRSKKRS